MAEAYIVEALRTAGGRRNGLLAGWHPADLAGEVLNALIDRTQIGPASVDDVILGCVTQAGEQAFAFGRNAVLASKLPVQSGEYVAGHYDYVIRFKLASMEQYDSLSDRCLTANPLVKRVDSLVVMKAVKGRHERLTPA